MWDALPKRPLGSFYKPSKKRGANIDAKTAGNVYQSYPNPFSPFRLPSTFSSYLLPSNNDAQTAGNVYRSYPYRVPRPLSPLPFALCSRLLPPTLYSIFISVRLYESHINANIHPRILTHVIRY